MLRPPELLLVKDDISNIRIPVKLNDKRDWERTLVKDKQTNRMPNLKSRVALYIKEKQGQIHGNPVADGWAGVVMQKPLAIQKYDLPTYRPTWQVLESRVRD